MQTINLSDSALGTSGKILTKRPTMDGLEKRELRLLPLRQIPRYRVREELVLDYLDGMSLFVLYREDGQQVFYLDRTLRLFRGTEFSVLPFGDVSRVCLFLPDENAMEQVGITDAAALQHDRTALHLGQIYTFFTQDTPKDFYFRGESHRPYELVYLDQGLLHNLISGSDILLHQQECLLIGRDDWHIQYADDPVRFLTISFDVDGGCLDALTNKPICLPQYLKPAIEKMLVERDGDSFSADYIEALLKIVLIELLREPESRGHEAQFPSTRHAENQIVDQALQIISRNIAGKIVLKELADAVHVSIPYLYELFDSHLGMPPGKYITKIRIEECKLLLREGDASIGDIAKRMGFSSIQHFSRQFRSCCGLSPTEYIRSLR